MKTIHKIFLAILFVVSFNSLSYSQCGTETVSVVGGGYCNNQNVEFQVSPTLSGVNYVWYNTIPVSTTLSLGFGNDFVSPNPISSTSGTVTFYYQKTIGLTGGPTQSITSSLGSAGLVTNNVQNYQVSYTSSTAFYLNYVTVSVYANSINTSSVYGLKVKVGSNYSALYTFTGSTFTNAGSNLYLVRVPVQNSLGSVGILGSSGSNSIQIIANDGTFTAPGLNTISGFAWYNPSFFNSTYTINSTLNLNVGASTNTIGGIVKVPGLYDYNITVVCPTATVTASPVSVGCCQPITVAPNLVSSNGTNIVVTPINPNVTISATGLSPSFYYQWYLNGVQLSGSSAAGIGVTNLSVNQTGVYTVRVVTTAGFLNRYGCFIENIYSLQARELFALVNNPILCLGQSTTFYAQGATGTVNWANSTYLSSVTTTGPTFTATSPGIYNYTLTGIVPVGNLVINGDFEQGYIAGTINPSNSYTYSNLMTGATTPPAWACFPSPTTYPQFYNGSTYLQKGGGNWNPGYFTINNYIPFLGYNGAYPCKDHTTGSGNYYFTDAYNQNSPTSVNAYLWSQSVVVQPNTNYEFAGWFTSYNALGDATKDWSTTCNQAATDVPGNPTPYIDILVNNSSILASPVTITSSVCQWQKVSAIWNSGNTSGPITLKITDWNTATYGNDFAMDDISFGAPGIQTDIATVTVSDCNFITVSQTSSCSGSVATISASTNGIFAGWTTTAGGTNGITSPSSSTTTVTTTGSNYVFKATANFLFGEMVSNGTFSQGFSGFTSSLNQTLPPNSLYSGQYAVTNNPPAYNASPNLYTSKPDVTGDATRNMLLVNVGANNSIIYSTTVTGVVAGTKYGLSLWLANVQTEFLKANPDTSNTYPNPKTANVQILINGTPLFSIKQPLDTVWRKYGATWTAASSGNAVIQIKNLINQGSGLSGFAIDNVSFSTVYSVTKTATIASSICSLPVNYLSFDLVNKPKSVEVDWQTTSEVNNSYFEIERSSDGVNFIALGKVNGAKNGSTKILDYLFTDYYPLNGTSYYRIKQVDLDGNYSYTPIRSIQRGASLLVQLYPNPSDNNFNISIISGTVDQIHASIKDISGKNISEFQFNSGDQLTFGNDLQPGVYLLQLQSGSYVEVLKLVKN